MRHLFAMPRLIGAKSNFLPVQKGVQLRKRVEGEWKGCKPRSKLASATKFKMIPYFPKYWLTAIPWERNDGRVGGVSVMHYENFTRLKPTLSKNFPSLFLTLGLLLLQEIHLQPSQSPTLQCHLGWLYKTDYYIRNTGPCYRLRHLQFFRNKACWIFQVSIPIILPTILGTWITNMEHNICL